MEVARSFGLPEAREAPCARGRAPHPAGHRPHHTRSEFELQATLIDRQPARPFEQQLTRKRGFPRINSTLVQCQRERDRRATAGPVRDKRSRLATRLVYEMSAVL